MANSIRFLVFLFVILLFSSVIVNSSSLTLPRTTFNNITVNGDLFLIGDILSLVDQELNASLLPSIDEKFDLGSITKKWRDIYLTLELGSVIFIDGSNKLANDNANFFWDDVNNRLGIGTNTPTETLEVDGNFSVGSNLIVTTGGNVGIGETSPGTKLEVNGDIRGDNFFLTDDTDSGMINTAADTLGLQAGGVTGLTIKEFIGVITVNTPGTLEVEGNFRGDDTVEVNDDASGTQGLEIHGDNDISAGNRRGGFTKWYHGGFVSETTEGYTFVNNDGQFVWDTTAQASQTDTGVAYVDFDDGSASFAGGDFDIDSSGNIIDVSDITSDGDITTTGNVGIGTTSPGASLDVIGDTIFNGTIGISTGATDAHINMLGTDKAGGHIRFASPFTGADADAMITVGDDSGGTSILMGANLKLSSGVPAKVDTTRNGSGIFARYDGNVRIFTDITERVRFDKFGNVGIGATNPAKKLTVDGNFNFSGGTSNLICVGGPCVTIGELTLSDRTGAVTFDIDSSSDSVISFDRNAVRKFVIGNDASFDNFGIAQKTFNAENMRFMIQLNSGNVGINTTTPNDKLEVIGNVRISGSANSSSFNTTTLQVHEDALIEGKLDIGKPGFIGGMDIGEGGSYTRNHEGDVIVQAFLYDASASSGSRFTELTLDASNSMLTNVGDRLYVGSVNLTWAVRFELSQGMGDDHLQMRYYDGDITNLSNMTHMTILKDSAISVGELLWNQTAEKEYTTWDHGIEDNWIKADNIDDLIPDGTEPMFWIVFEVLDTGITGTPVFEEIMVRGTDTDFVTGLAHQVYWGDARLGIHERINLNTVKSAGGTTTSNVDIDSAHSQTVFNFNGAGDELEFFWIVPECIDTSSKVEVKLDWAANQADTFDFTLSASKLQNNTIIGAGVTPGFQTSFSLTSDAANTMRIEEPLTSEGISIENLTASDVISVEFERTDGANSFYPFSLTIHHLRWCNGNLAALED